MTRLPPALAAGILALAALAPGSVAAQIDYRNLDDERPVATEDAYAVERYAFELLAPYRFVAERGGVDSHVLEPELEYGAAPNLQVGLKVPLAAVRGATGTDWGLGGVRVHALYNFNTEGPGLPALALRGDWAIPVGNLAGGPHRATLKAIATRSWGRFRLHVNAAASLGADAGLGRLDPPARWLAGAALDRTFIRSSVLAVAELVVRRPTSSAPTEANVAAGLRWQWTPMLVLDVGVARRLASSGPDLGLTVGLSRTFAIRALYPGPSR